MPNLSKVARLALAAVVGLLAWSAAPAHAGLIHQYQLNGSLADDFAGPSLVAAGGSLNATNYSFGANQGLSLSGGLATPGTYSIEMVFHFDNVSGFRKILDFKDRTSDTGLYNLSNA